MCILFIAIEQHPKYPLIIAANRDEFYHRPTAVSNYWAEYPNVLAGRDLHSGGSWMGINEQGYIAALTNFRDPMLNQLEAPSRGLLVVDYLKRPIKNYHEKLNYDAARYNGYNLLYGHWHQLSVYNNVSKQYKQLSSGIYGLSNAMLDTPWPKLSHGAEQFKQALSKANNVLDDSLFSVLSDQTVAPDEALPDTGIGRERERVLSSIFINSEGYGTRSSTILRVSCTKKVTWVERTFSSQGGSESEQHYSFYL